MKKSVVILLVAVVLLASAPSLFAQETVTDIFGIEVGTIIGYNFFSDNVGAGQTMAISFGLGEQFEAAMVFISGTGALATNLPNMSLIRMSYYLLDEVGLRLYSGASTGAGGGPAAGFGVFSTPIRRSFNDTLTTALGLGLDYLIPSISARDLDEGILAVGLTATIAF